MVLEETHFLGGYIALILQYHGRGGLTCWCHFPPKVPYPLASYFYNIMYILLCLYDSSTNEVLALAQNLASAQLLLSKCKPTWKIHTCLDNFGDQVSPWKAKRDLVQSPTHIELIQVCLRIIIIKIFLRVRVCRWKSSKYLVFSFLTKAVCLLIIKETLNCLRFSVYLSIPISVILPGIVLVEIAFSPLLLRPFERQAF